MDIRQLEYFQSVAHTKNLTRSAQHLHVSQSTITLALQKLEQEFGVALFDRSQKQFDLTPEGLVFFDRVSHILNHLQDTIGEMNEYRRLQKGSVKIGVPPMMAACLFPGIIAGFKARYPQLQLSVYEDASFGIRQALERGELDIGIVNLMNPSGLLKTLPLIKQEFLLCLPKGHPLCAHPVIDIKMLSNDPMILFKEGAYNRKLIIQECLDNGFAPNIIIATDQIEAIKRLIAHQVGISFLIESLAAGSEHLITRSLKKPLFLEFGLAWGKEKYLSTAAQAFIEFVERQNSSNTAKNPSR